VTAGFRKPDFSDNRAGRTLAAALEDYLEWLHENRTNPVSLSIATGYFNPEGFSVLADSLQGVEQVRLLLGAEPQTPPRQYWRKPGEPRGDRYHAELIHQALQGHEEGLKHDRNLLGFQPAVDAVLQHLLDFLDSGKIEVRRYENGFLHGKAFLFSDGEGVLAGSSNFTRAGLTSNLELNLGHYHPDTVHKVSNWFEDLWAEAEPYDLASLYEARYQPYDPYLIYLRVLYELYADELRDEEEDTGHLELTTFQTDGVFRARRILERYHGVIVADGVGLGKSFIGGRLLEETVREERQRAMLIAPAALRDGNWKGFRSRHGFYFDLVSPDQLRSWALVGGDRHYDELSHPNEYSMVVIDEAHAFRNPDTQQASALRDLLRGDPPKDVVMLTATPVNNSLWDLYYLLDYFVGHDAVFADAGIPSLKDRFRDAQERDPHELRPDLLYDVLDRTTVRRTRHFVKKWYQTETIPGPDGERIPIVFPEPKVERVDYDLEGALPGFLADFAVALAGDNSEEELSLARYWPSRYKRVRSQDDPDLAREGALVGLIRSGLLKRFESSVHAFSRTAERMAEANEAFLRALDEGYVPSPQALDEWQQVDSDEAWNELLEETGSDPVGAYKAEALREDVRRDRDLFREFARRTGRISRHEDPKLAALADELAVIAQEARREGGDTEDVRQKRKVLIFTYFEDSVDWIEEYLREVVQDDPRLEPYRDRIASVAGSESRGGVTRRDAIYGFAPVSTEAPAGRDDDKYDILVATDVLAEGMNLQQCRNIINFDLPWNPMRLVQRHGRIDRIGSPHSRVFMRCFFPDEQLDELLNLELRVRTKLAQAAATVGLSSEVIPDAATAERNFSETREQIEALRREEEGLLETAGERPGAHSAEEYRQELRKGLIEQGDQIRQLPWAAGSGLRGPEAGHFFCARVGDQVKLRFVPMEDEPVERHTLGCLRMITCSQDTERVLPNAMYAQAYDAWRTARRDIYDEWQFATDPANLHPRIRPLFRHVAEHLRHHPPTGMEQDELTEILESVEAPRGMRDENALREVWNRFHDENDEVEEPKALSAALVEKIRDLGFQPWQPPEELDPIEEDEVKLVCWMAVVGPKMDPDGFGEAQGDLGFQFPGDQLQLDDS